MDRSRNTATTIFLDIDPRRDVAPDGYTGGKVTFRELPAAARGAPGAP
jgi:hypothetical protein